MDITEASAAAAAEQTRRLRHLCVAVHHKCRANAKHLDALLNEVNTSSYAPPARAELDPEIRAQEEAKEKLLEKRVDRVVQKLQLRR